MNVQSSNPPARQIHQPNRNSDPFPAIPQELKHRKQWHVYVLHDGHKIPIDPKTGRWKDFNQHIAENWLPYDDAVKAWRRNQPRIHGIGYQFSPDDPYTGIDLDDCIHNGQIANWAQEIIQQCASYAEVSPSGYGVKIWVCGNITRTITATPITVRDGILCRAEPNESRLGCIELYSQKQFFTTTGNHIAGTPTIINSAQNVLDTLYTTLKKPEVFPKKTYTETTSNSLAVGGDARRERWARGIVRNKLRTATATIAGAGEGCYHDARIRAGRLVGGLLAWLDANGYTHLLSEESAIDHLYSAKPPLANDKDEHKTIVDAIAHGRTEPLDIAPPTPRPRRTSQPTRTSSAESNNIIRVNQKYLDVQMPAAKVLFTIATMGTGKTEFTARSTPNDASVLVIGHRVALIEQQSQRFKIDSYRDSPRELHKCNRLAITLDSLLKLDTETQRFDYVIIDEVEQVLAHLTGNTIKPDQRASVLHALAFWIKQAKRIVLMDAHLGVITKTFIQHVLPNVPCTTLINEYKPANRIILRCKAVEEVMSKLKRNVNQGQTAYVACNSIKKVKRIETDLRTTFPNKRIIAVHGDNSGDTIVQHFIDNINTEISNYDIVIASPSIGTGVSIDAIHFDAVYLIGIGNTTTHTDLLQQAGRVRTIKSGKVYAWIDPKPMYNETDPEMLAVQILANVKKTGIALKFDDAGKRHAVDDFYLTLWCTINAARHRSLNNLAENFYAAVADDGHTIINADEIDATERHAIRTALVAAQRQNDQTTFDQVVAAPTISDDRAKEIDSSIVKSDDDRAALKQHEIRSFYGVSSDEITLDLLKLDKNGLKTKVATLAQVIDPTIALRKDRHERSHLQADQRHHTIKRNMLESFLRVMETFEHVVVLTKTPTPNVTALIPPHSEKMITWIAQHKLRIRQLFNLRVDETSPRSVSKFVSSMFGLIGLRLKKLKQDKKTGKRVYVLDAERLAMMHRYVQHYINRSSQHNNVEVVDHVAHEAQVIASGSTCPVELVDELMRIYDSTTGSISTFCANYGLERDAILDFALMLDRERDNHVVLQPV